jgi:uncharacterized protein (TIGR02448 family)
MPFDCGLDRGVFRASIEKENFMTKMVLAMALMMGAQALAQMSSEGTTAGLGLSTVAPSVTTICAAGCAAYDGVDAKVILAAKDDATAYVVSNGQIPSAALERAFELIRSTGAGAQVTDMELAQAIMNQH